MSFYVGFFVHIKNSKKLLILHDIGKKVHSTKIELSMK